MNIESKASDSKTGNFYDKVFRIFILAGILALTESIAAKWYTFSEALLFFIDVLIIFEFLYSLYHTWPRESDLKNKHGIVLLFISIFSKESKEHIKMSYIRVALLLFSLSAITSLEFLYKIH